MSAQALAVTPSPLRYLTARGRPCPGVTSILRDLGRGTDLSWVEADRLEALGARGTRVHRHLAFAAVFQGARAGFELYDGLADIGPPPPLNSERGFAQAGLNWLAAQPFHRLGAERRLVREHPRQPYGGTLDLWGLQLSPSALWIVDYKLRPGARGDGLQLAGYLMALRAMHPEHFTADRRVRRRVIELRGDGTYREHPHEAWASQDDLEWRRCLAEWWGLYGDQT